MYYNNIDKCEILNMLKRFKNIPNLSIQRYFNQGAFVLSADGVNLNYIYRFDDVWTTPVPADFLSQQYPLYFGNFSVNVHTGTAPSAGFFIEFKLPIMKNVGAGVYTYQNSIIQNYADGVTYQGNTLNINVPNYTNYYTSGFGAFTTHILWQLVADIGANLVNVFINIEFDGWQLNPS